MANQNVRLKQISTDSLVIGSNIAAWLTASRLKRSGKSVLLVDSRDQRDFSSSRPFRNNFDMFSASGLKHINDLGAWINREIKVESSENTPVTVESGQLTPFLGFGDRKFNSIDELTPLISNTVCEIDVPSKDIYQKVAAELDGSIYYQSEVTQFETEDKKIAATVINGSTRITAEQVCFCDSPKLFLELLKEGSGANKKASQTLSRAQLWTTIGLEFIHDEPQTELSAQHVLMGNKTDFGPCLGYFYQVDRYEPHRRGSVWISLVDDEGAEDTAYVGSVIRNMKRQIKRAYPEFFEAKHEEKIWVMPSDFGNLGFSESDFQVLGLENLSLTSPLWDESAHGLGSALSIVNEVALGAK